jgi:hypothetical protein
LSIIVLASLGAGMLSVLLIVSKTPQTTAN